MIAALLNLARVERQVHGHVLDATKQRLLSLGITERDGGGGGDPGHVRMP